MRTLSIASALMLGSATMAQAAPADGDAVPLCLRAMTDSCVEAAPMGQAATHPRHHRPAHAARPARTVAAHA